MSVLSVEMYYFTFYRLKVSPLIFYQACKRLITFTNSKNQLQNMLIIFISYAFALIIPGILFYLFDLQLFSQASWYESLSYYFSDLFLF